MGGKLSHVLADRLRITRGEAGRRVAEAADLGARRAMTGEPLPPQLPATAPRSATGIGAGQSRVIRGFFDQLPCWVDIQTRECAEAHLAGLATQFRPETVRKIADRLAVTSTPTANSAMSIAPDGAA